MEKLRKEKRCRVGKKGRFFSQLEKFKPLLSILVKNIK
ncbi:MAG: hypothetical protein TRG1_1763 [Flavobacteriaceae bacterium FS1-H7996/R]|nr:MAG: hypothetical protein TRG1_1763 [Flavobacteriaceae bacterium FS1-H7996/R]